MDTIKNNSHLMSNQGLNLKQLLKKRDLLSELINLGYDLNEELAHCIKAIEKTIDERK